VKLSSGDPGLVVSGVGHAALLIAILVAFSSAKQFGDAQESIPVEMVTDQQFAEIMKGVKTEKEVKPQPLRVDKVADIAETHKVPPIVEAKTDVAPPPPRLRPTEDPGQDDQPQPAPVPPAPPPRPADLPKAEAKPEPPPKPDAEAIVPPQPPPRPKDEPKKADVSPPLPPVRPVQNDQAKPADKLKLDEVAKLIAASKPKSGDETADPQPRLNLAEVSQLLSKEPPQQKASTGRELSQVASLGSPTASAAKMSPSLWGQLDGLMREQYKQCWSYLGLNDGDQYIPEIKVEFTPDGALAGQPALRNPPSDPNLRSLADSALRAVERCNPLKIPPQYAPYYDEWKSRILRFDPEEMAG
jgi:colicin import membrane protein